MVKYRDWGEMVSALIVKKAWIITSLLVSLPAFRDVTVTPVYLPNEDVKVWMLYRGRPDAIVGFGTFV